MTETITSFGHVRRPVPDLAAPRRLGRDEPVPRLLGGLRGRCGPARDGTGYGLAFTVGRGNDVQVAAIEALAPLVVGRPVDEVLDDTARSVRGC